MSVVLIKIWHFNASVGTYTQCVLPVALQKYWAHTKHYIYEGLPTLVCGGKKGGMVCQSQEVKLINDCFPVVVQ